MLCLVGEAVLLLRWRDPVGGAVVWEPPGGGVEPGETFADTARRELSEEAGVVAPELAHPVFVARDYVWAGRRIVTRDAVFLARFDAAPVVTPEPVPELLGFSWCERLDAVGPLEPPELPALLSSLRSARPSPRSR